MGFGIPIVGDIISGVGNYLGAVKTANAMEQAADYSRASARESIEAQKEFAQHGVKWRVDDAREAGISPLAALGANLTSFSPVSVFDSPNTSVGDKYRALGQMGQDISRSISATLTAREREAELKAMALKQDAADKLKLEHMGLENELLRKQILEVGKPQNDFPDLTGGGSQQMGFVPDFQWAMTEAGPKRVMSEDMYLRNQSDPLGGIMWNIRNRLMPTLVGPSDKNSVIYPSEVNRPGYEVLKSDEVFVFNPWTRGYEKKTVKFPRKKGR